MGKAATTLFLDIQGAFPNTTKNQLLLNMKSQGVPTGYVKLIDRMLTNRSTRLKFDDFTSDPISILNGTTQGCPLSMLLYAFYNTPLIEVANHKGESINGFVDDTKFLAVGSTLADCHATLKHMMERNSGGFNWSTSHGSPFELTKTALVN